MHKTSPKILVINSFGPMGSTLLASLCEKIGFGNVPLRKIGLHHYLMGEKELNSGYMQRRLEAVIKEHAKEGLYGGVSVLDRDNQKAKSLVDFAAVYEDLEILKTRKFDSIQELYLACRSLYDRAVIYKKTQNYKDWHIELTTDIHRYSSYEIAQAYAREFEDVSFVNLRRDFSGWINSLASQAFAHPHLKQRIKFFPYMRNRDFALYESAIQALPGIDIHFDEMFETPVEELAARIAKECGVELPELDWRSENYDMYGKSQPWSVAFVKFDDNIEFLKRATLRKMDLWAKGNKFQTSLCVKIYSWLLYLKDMMCYRMRAKAS